MITEKDIQTRTAEILADAGFNTARCAADQIDDFASAGLMVLMKVPESLPKFTDSAHFERWDRMCGNPCECRI